MAIEPMMHPSVTPPLRSSIDTGMINPYTCRTLIRIDASLWRLRGKRICWLGGRLCERMPAGHGVELRSHFPDLPVAFDFNGKTVVVRQTDDPVEVARSWWRAAYGETPEETAARR